MTRILVIGDGDAELIAQLDGLGLSTIITVKAFREVVNRMPCAIDVPMIHQSPTPKFGGNRPYLKKKKGRP